MPTTKELVNYLELNAPGWNRVGEKGVLGVLNQAQNILMCQEAEEFVGYTSGGVLPAIATSDGVRQYTLNQAATGLSKDIWRVGMVLTKADSDASKLFTEYGGYSGVYDAQRPNQPYWISGIEYIKFYQVTVKDALEAGHPTLTFTMNPGASTDTFFIYAFERPDQLTAETIPLSIPQQFHMSHLLPTALKLLDAMQNGNWIEAMQMIEEKYKPEFLNEMNMGDHGSDHTVTRYEY